MKIARTGGKRHDFLVFIAAFGPRLERIAVVRGQTLII
jgi:hypothetical protein